MALQGPTAQPVYLGDGHGDAQSNGQTDAVYGRKRRRAFFLTALIFALVGSAYTLLQPAEFRSRATVLMSAPTAIDQQLEEADVQGVAIQRRVLTGKEITESLSQTLERDSRAVIDPTTLRAMLQVNSVSETNLLELSATGPDAALLPTLVESWIAVYTTLRAKDIDSRKTQTLTEVEEQLLGLEETLSLARDDLAAFRTANEIISMERQENAVLAQLEGLNTALNTAVEEEVKAQAYLSTLRESLARGEQVVPEGERSTVAEMSRELNEVQARLKELRLQYTDDYIRKDPRLRELPGRERELTEALDAAYKTGGSAELARAEREFAAARSTVTDLEQRLENHKAKVTNFSTVYATHEALKQDLERLEELKRETEARLVQIEVKQVEKYPQVAVIDPPAPAALRIGPPYGLLFGVTAGSALFAGIFAAWLYSYLNPRSKAPAYVTLTGVHMYPPEGASALEQLTPQQARLAAQHEQALTQLPEHEASPEKDDGSEDRPGPDADNPHGDDSGKS